MKFYSTGHQTAGLTFKEAILSGRPGDGGLFMPQMTGTLPSAFFNNLSDMTLHDIAFVVMRMLVGSEMSPTSIKDMVDDALDFEIPLVHIEGDIYSLEMFHGPTQAFKDVGARFLSRLLRWLCGVDENNPATVLVATTGDAGSAVAGSFYGLPGINVMIVYPHGRVTREQEAQFASLGANIYPIEVDGTFDDCQAMVASMLSDKDLCHRFRLVSANTVNPGRLLPQTIPYIWGVAQLRQMTGRVSDTYISIPSGNLGNLCSALFARAIGLPVKQFIAVNNINDIFVDFINTGQYAPRRSLATIASAMDVGSPSNILRIMDIYRRSDGKIDIDLLRRDIKGVTVNDAMIVSTIAEVYKRHGYLLDPHGATAMFGLKEIMPRGAQGFFVETAHPAKFSQAVISALGVDCLPAQYRLYDSKGGIKHTYRIPPTPSALRRKLFQIIES